MTDPYSPPVEFQDNSLPPGQSIELDGPEPANVDVKLDATDRPKLPPAIIEITEDQETQFKTWLDEWLNDLIAMQQPLQAEWAEQEAAYRARPDVAKMLPFVGASSDVVPLTAMAVDPIHARLETGIFKQDPVFRFKPLKRSTAKYTPALETFFEFYHRHKLKLRQVCSPRILEGTKHGTFILKTVYEHEKYTSKGYDNDWKVVDKVRTAYKGPKVLGVGLGDFLFPPHYQHLQHCPVVAERIRTTYERLLIAEASGKLKNCSKIKNQQTPERTQLEATRESEAKHQETSLARRDLIVYEVWGEYSFDPTKPPFKFACTYHLDTRTILQLRYNWYFHQKKPYTVIPYTITNDSLYGIGICEMTVPFQKAITRWQQMASDNAYIANIRMFIVKKESGIEDVPRLYAGRCFFVDDPRADFIPFAGGDIYPSTLSERQNIFGLAEKRTGVSDYLTGRESPIVGSRATATSTLALIQEGTKRVEEVLENIRIGLSEVVEFCFYIWIQYGLDGLDDIAFGDDEVGMLVKEFFNTLDEDNISSIAIDLAATDASGNRQVMQQMQLQIIQIMMQYLEKLIQAGAEAMNAQQNGQPQLAAMLGDVMTASRKMFSDLLHKYEIPNPEDYLPDLSRYLNGMENTAGQGGAAGVASGTAGPQGASGIPGGARTLSGVAVPRPAAPGEGASNGTGLPATRPAPNTI